MMPHGGQLELPSLVAAVQGGSVVAARRLVEHFQYDAIGVAYLVTGSRDEASDLAGRMFELAFDRIGAFDPEDDFYAWLLRHIPTALITVDLERPGQPAGVPLAGAEAARFQVDDDRSRLWNALELLPQRERLQLVLSDYAGLSEQEATSIATSGSGDGASLQPLDETRRRLRVMASIDAGQPVSTVLRRLAVDAPRSSLWTEIEEDVEDGFARRRLRSRLTGLGAVAAVLVLLGGVGIFLLYGALGSDDSTPTGAGAPADSNATLPPSTEAPQPTATPVPYIPVGDVPDLLLYELATTESAWGVADPSSATGGQQLPEGDLAGISPDGGTLLLIHQVRTAERIELTLRAASSATGEELWSADVRPLAEGGPNSVYYDLVVIDDLIYVASHDSSYLENIMTVVVIRLEDGSMRDIWGLDVGIDFSQPGLTVDLYGSVAPQPPALTVHVRSGLQGWQKIHQTALINGVTIFESDLISGLGDPVGSRFIAPDGRGIIVIPPQGLADAPAVSYLTFDTMTYGEIELPFAPIEELGGVVVEYVPSHDGMRLFALDIYNRQVAIIDLELRQVERVVDLASGENVPVSTPEYRPWTIPGQLAGSAAALSPDGQHLYALTPPIERSDDPYPPASGVWKIDTDDWTIEAEWLLGDWVIIAAIQVDSTGDYLYLHRPGTSITEPGEITYETAIADTANGRIAPSSMVLDGLVAESIADLYRRHYGRSPSVDGVVPRDNETVPDRPVVEVEIEPRTGPSGMAVDIQVTLLDPVTGERLTSVESSDLRSPIPPSITAAFSNGDQRRTAFLGRSGTGSYQGQIVLDLPGDWGLTLTAGDPETDGWSVIRSSVVEIVDTIPGPDGRDYVLQVTSYPDDDPVAGRLTDLTVRFVAAGNNPTTPLNAEISENLPPDLDMTFADGTVTTLFRSGVAAYSGFVRFPSPGVAFPTVTFTGFDGQPVTLAVRVEVGS